MSFLSLSRTICLLPILEQRHSEIEDVAGRVSYSLSIHNLSHFFSYTPIVLKMGKPRQSTSARCKTLAHALKRLFKSVKAQNANNSLDAPVNIIRKDLSRASLLPRISGVSLFPDFKEPEADHDTFHEPVPSLQMPFHTITSQESRKILLPTKSLSHFNLHQVYTDHSALPDLRTTRERHFRPTEQVIHACTGSIPAYKPVLVSKTSTLQIGRPGSLYANISNASLAASFASDTSSSVIRRTKRPVDLRKCATAESLAADSHSLTHIAEHNHFSDPKTSHEDAFHLVRHFASFCIIDILAPGCPVSAVSEDLRYLYDIKDRFVLNAQECSELSMDLSVGRDPDGNEVTYVLLFSPLVSPATAKSRFMLVSAIDVSGYVRYAASLEPSAAPRQEDRSLNSFREKSNPKPKLSPTSWINEKTDQLADELLHGCSIKGDLDSGAAHRHKLSRAPGFRRTSLGSEDVWTSIATEEGLVSRHFSAASKWKANMHGASNHPSCRKQKQATASTEPQSTLDHAEEKVLEEFIESLQVLYSESFLLACSPLNGQFYEICYVSPAVYASGEYVSGHLSHTPFNLINDFGAHLAGGRRFRTTIRWGNEGIEKRLYCVPLIGHQHTPWICILVDKETPIHW